MLAVPVLAVTCARGDEPSSRAPEKTATAEVVKQFCTSCHGFAEPSTLPRRVWVSEISKMYATYWERAGGVAIAGEAEEVLRWFEQHAPEEVELPHPLPASRQRSVEIVDRVISGAAPQVSFVQIAALRDGPLLDRITCDFKRGVVIQAEDPESEPASVQGRVPFPARACVVDLDQDGRRDVVVASLGGPLAEDHDFGGVYWLRQLETGEFEVRIVLDRVGRVSDVKAADLDGDGDMDLAVAVFGWNRTGKVLWLEQAEDGSFGQHELDDRAGGVALQLADMNEDGRLDVVVYMAQEHEQFMLFESRSGGDFQAHLMWDSGNPDWGSNGFEIADMDADGDLDVIAVNGDVLDNGVAKPFHGIHWLENNGLLEFRHHQLAVFPGAMVVRVADMDGDQDLDVVSGSMLPADVLNLDHGESRDAVLFLEQRQPGQFEAFSLLQGKTDVAALDVGGVGSDGRRQIMLGHFSLDHDAAGGTARTTVIIMN